MASSFSAFQSFLRKLQQLSMRIDVSKTIINNTSVEFLDAFVDHMFEFVDHPLLPSQSNFAPVDALGEAVLITNIEGQIPDDFPEGPNPLFGGLSRQNLYLGRKVTCGYKEKECFMLCILIKELMGAGLLFTITGMLRQKETFKLEKLRNKQSLFPAVQGDAPAVVFRDVQNRI